MRHHDGTGARTTRITAGTHLNPGLAAALAILTLFWASLALQLIALAS